MFQAHVSIIIIAYNEQKYLPRLLNSLVKQMLNPFEVIIVDSDSKDRTGSIALSYKDKLPSLKYLKLPVALGPAYARNRGAEISSYERLLFLDADTRVKPDFIERVIAELLLYDPDVATCPIRIAENHLASNLGAIFLNSFMILMKPVYSAAYGACIISTKSIHVKLDGFREDLGLCEDCNYIKRARRNHKMRFKILSPYFFTSDRRAMLEGGADFFLKYIRIHLLRMFTGREILKDEIKYEYGNFYNGDE